MTIEDSIKKCAETAKYVGVTDLLQNIIKNQTLSKYNTFHYKLRENKVKVPKYRPKNMRIEDSKRNVLKVRNTLV